MARGRHTHERRIGAIAVIAAVAVGFVMLAFGGVAYAAYRYEMTHADRILPGVQISGVDVGGMTRADASRAVRQAVGTALQEQVTVTIGGDHWTTTLDSLGRRAAIGKAVEGALAAGEDLGTFDRAWHRIRDESIDIEVPLVYRTTGSGVEDWVARIAKDVAVAPRNASVGISADMTDIVKVHGKTGTELAKASAVAAIHRALDHGRDTVTLHARVVQPKVTDQTLGRTIVVHLDRNELDLYDGFNVIRTWDVATAKPGFTTPDGDWTIYSKQVDPTWHNPAPDGWGAGEPLVVGPGPDNPMGPRALYLTAPGLIRIHGTSDDASIGRYASHGCIRMHNTDVVQLYPMVPVGTHVLVVGYRPASAVYWDTPPGKDT
jgi:lipoprotein-anchoring transpeptidase ErfK/SrfK